MTRAPSATQIAAIKATAFVACLIPLVLLALRAWRDQLGANPIEYITRATGWWTLTFLMITLTVTPARKLLSMPWLLRLRRMLGLFAFFYASLHFTTYIWLDQFFDLGDIAKDVVKRPVITVGFSAFVLLIPLAATSTNAMVRRLGAERWRWLHRVVYVIGILGVTHFLWLVKKDIREPLVYMVILAWLLGLRLWWRWRESPAAPPVRAAPGRGNLAAGQAAGPRTR